MLLTLTAIIAGISALGVAVAIIAYLTIVIVRRYLEKLRSKVRNAAKRFIARYKEGNYERIATGIWDDDWAQVTDGNSWKAENLDPVLSEIGVGEVRILDFD